MVKNSRKLNDNLENNYKICRDICKRIIKKAKIKCSVYGENNIPEENCLIISNHISFFDIILFVSQIENPIGFAYASNLLKIPFLKKFINSIGGVSIHKDIKKIKQSISNITNYLKESRLVIFPEGGCSYAIDKVKKFQRGCFISLKTLNIPIVPVFLKVEELGKIGRWVMPIDKIDIIVGKPFKSDSKMTSKELAEYAYDTVVNLKNCYN
ncbi:MAG: 1-acyl-sn-glycerol-3-phosphate acyltransferase [Ruminococcus sp.]|nr:1-acyl-sn-glycerol-3-phosphate acyltransferase [Ruminococcus sp.]